VVWSGAYDAFGNCEVGVETVVSNLRLPGQYYDAETGLYYNLNRYYDPKIGRYLQPDPAGDGLNPYLYAGGNPVNAIDPNGLCAMRMIGGIAEIGWGMYVFGQTLSFGSLPAWLAIANGVDNFQAGWNSLLAGEAQYAPILEAPIHALIPNETVADWVYMGTQLGIGYTQLQAEWALQATRPIQVASKTPLGFSSADDFAQFGSNLKSGLSKAGFDDVQPIFQGSSVTGKSFRTGQPFDVGRVSDFDVALASPKMLQKAKELGIPLRSKGVRTAPLKPIHLEKLGLTDLVSLLSSQARRPVNFMIFDSTATATAKAPSIFVP
jgi:RHS repeat-associated protein